MRAASFIFSFISLLLVACSASDAAGNPSILPPASKAPTLETLFVNHTYSGPYARNSTDLYKGNWNLLREGACFPWPKFRKSSGSLTLDFKQRATVSGTFDVVLGELSFRDGLYSTDRQVGYDVQGLFFHSEGLALLYANKDDAPALKDIAAVLPTNATAKGALSLLQNIRSFMNISANETLPDFLTLAVQFHPLTPHNVAQWPHASTDVSPRRVGRASPQLFFSAIAVSSNCSSSFNMSGDSYVFSKVARQALNYVTFIALFSFGECLLLIRQMDYTESQSSLMKVSLLAIGQQTVMDSYLCLIHLTVGVVFDDVFNAFAFAAFLKFIVFALFEMRYLMLIWRSRRPNTFDGWGGVRRELSQLYTRFYLGLLGGLLAFYFFGASALLVFTMYSFWVPQIWRTAVRGERGGILPKYALGVSLTRLFIPIYFYLCPANLLHAEPRPVAGLALATWVCLQTAIVLAQEYWGARFFVPSKFLPPRYDYHRLPLSHEHADCVICMSPVALQPAEFMLTPCGHLFHRECLIQWMAHKLECPTCRAVLPVFDER